MKSRNLLLFGVIALLTVFTYQSCDMVKVDGPDLNVTEYNPTFSVQGIITDAVTGEAISGVTVNVGSNQVITDNEGVYNFTDDKALNEGTFVTVELDGYIKAVSTINYGSDIPNIIFVDLALTRALPENFVDLTSGGTLTFEDVTIEVPADNSATLNGETVNTLELSVTPLSPITTMGNWVGASLKTLKFSPEGVVFEKPIKVYINNPEGIEYSNLTLYIYNSDLNIWEATTDPVNYEGNQINFELKTLVGSIHIADPAHITIDSDIIGSDPYFRFEPNTCDCSQAYVWSGGLYFRKMTLSTNPLVPNTGNMAELNSMHFFSQNNLPYNPSIIAGILVYPAVSGVSLNQCEKAVVDVTPMYREITGSYVYDGETKGFVIKYVYGSSNTVSYEDCPVTSQCHQGCI